MVQSPIDAYKNFGQFKGLPTVDQFGQRSTPALQPIGFVNDFVDQMPNTTAASVNAFQNDFTNPSFGSQSGYQNTFTQQGYADPYSQQNASFGGGGNVSLVGGAWSALDAHNNEFANAAYQFGAPANLLKAMVNRESSGNWERDGNRIATFQRHDGSWAEILPFVGITKAAADAWGLDFYGMQGNKQAQINGMATIMSGLAGKYGGYENAVKVYFGGEEALNRNWKDENGLDSDYYYNTAVSDWKMLDQKAGYTGGYGDGGVGTGIVNEALQFVGVPYVWGSLPSAGDDPWQTGWDCSAFVNYLDDKYGNDELPAGSHYQWQDTVNKGLVVQDPSQLRAGDLVFFDTGLRGGGGAEMNNASHVGMYIGNGQFIQAANQNAGTIVSNLNEYIQMYGFLGGRKMGWSGGGQVSNPTKPRFSNLIQQYLLAA